jgi:hypothetical protein
MRLTKRQVMVDALCKKLRRKSGFMTIFRFILVSPILLPIFIFNALSLALGPLVDWLYRLGCSIVLWCGAPLEASKKRRFRALTLARKQNT